MPRPFVIVEVDEQLEWVVRLPELLTGAARAAVPDELAEMNASFDALSETLADPSVAAGRHALADRVGRAVRAALEAAGGPPDLPFIGEPFGGEGGTD